jgi:hypothetical protein
MAMFVNVLGWPWSNKMKYIGESKVEVRFTEVEDLLISNFEYFGLWAVGNGSISVPDIQASPHT